MYYFIVNVIALSSGRNYYVTYFSITRLRSCNFVTFRTTLAAHFQGWFYVGAGDNSPQTLALLPKCDMKHCLTNTKHWHEVQKWRSVAFKICQNVFPAGASLTTLPRPPSRL